VSGSAVNDSVCLYIDQTKDLLRSTAYKPREIDCRVRSAGPMPQGMRISLRIFGEGVTWRMVDGKVEPMIGQGSEYFDDWASPRLNNLHRHCVIRHQPLFGSRFPGPGICYGESNMHDGVCGDSFDGSSEIRSSFEIRRWSVSGFRVICVYGYWLMYNTADRADAKTYCRKLAQADVSPYYGELQIPGLRDHRAEYLGDATA